MKQNALKFIGIFLIGILTLSSCSSDDSTDNGSTGDTSSLFDKWWYDTGDFAADLYFSASGDFEQRVFFGSNEIINTGVWVWEDESNGITKINYLDGNGQVLSEVYLKISNLEETTMTIQQSTTNENYSIEVFYSDTDE